MKILCLSFLACLGLLTWSCSGKSDADASKKPKSSDEKSLLATADKDTPSNDSSESKGDSERKSEAVPDPDAIGEDCVAFLRATKAIPAHPESNACPTCPTSNATVEVLQFQRFNIDNVSFEGSNCEISVRIFAQFNPSSGGPISGGLLAWIPPEQREQYARGETPAGQQVYKVKVTYTRDGPSWRPVEFDRDLK